jgi:signal transduction histidine kinase
VEVGEALESLRTLARGVYPPLLESEGPRAALTARSRMATLRVTVRCGSERYPREVEAAVYFCCSEALQNMVKHAAASRGSICVWREDDRLRFEVRDDGHGFADRCSH